MEGRIVFRYPPSKGPLNPATGKHSEVPGAIQYDGPFKLQSFMPYETKPETGDHTAVVQRYRIDIPEGSSKVLEGAIGVIVATSYNQRNVGRRFRVAAPFGKTYATAQRLPVDELVG